MGSVGLRVSLSTQMNFRCVQLVLSTDYDNPTIWAEFINKMKDGILSAFDAALLQREEEVKRSEGQRHIPGWNFCTFFILKARKYMQDLEPSFDMGSRRVLLAPSRA